MLRLPDWPNRKNTHTIAVYKDSGEDKSREKEIFMARIATDVT